jgi:hypothetical protein
MPRLDLAAVVVAAVLASWSEPRGSGQNVGISTPPDDVVRNCSDLSITFDKQPALRGEDLLSVPKSSTALKVRPPKNGGVYVFGSGRSDFAVSACKAAISGRSLLDQIHASVHEDTVSAVGPSEEGWIVFFIVEAPNDGALDLEAVNGPITVREFSGRTTVRTQNGPIGLSNVSGQISAHAQNGPIAFTGRTGAVDLETQNGPLLVRLAGVKWSSGTLTGRARNGPLKLDVPRTFASGVRVQSSSHSPWACKGSACEEARRSWDGDTRWLELGSGPILVRLSTENGPVSVQWTP